MATSNGHRSALEALGEGFNIKGWKAAIDKLSCERIDKVSKGWTHSLQFAKAMNCSDVHARATLRILYEKGLADRQKFRVQLGEVVRPITHYKLK